MVRAVQARISHAKPAGGDCLLHVHMRLRAELAKSHHSCPHTIQDSYFARLLPRGAQVTHPLPPVRRVGPHAGEETEASRVFARLLRPLVGQGARLLCFPVCVTLTVMLDRGRLVADQKGLIIVSRASITKEEVKHMELV